MKTQSCTCVISIRQLMTGLRTYLRNVLLNAVLHWMPPQSNQITLQNNSEVAHSARSVASFLAVGLQIDQTIHFCTINNQQHVYISYMGMS